MAKVVFVRFGKVTIDWDESDNLIITREDNMQSIKLSQTEWAMVQRVAFLHDWPVAPPYPGSEEQG